MENKKNNKGLRKYRIKVAVEEEKFSTGREGKFCAAMLPLKWFIFFLYEIFGYQIIVSSFHWDLCFNF